MLEATARPRRLHCCVLRLQCGTACQCWLPKCTAVSDPPGEASLVRHRYTARVPAQVVLSGALTGTFPDALHAGKPPSLPLSLQGGFLHGSPSPRLQPSSSTSRHLSAAGSECPNATDDTGSGSFGRSTVVHEGTAGRAGSLTPFQAALASGQPPLLSQQHARSPTAADAAALGSAAPLSEAAHRQHATSRSGTASSSMRPAPPASGGNQSSRPSSGRQPSRQVHQLLRAVHTL